MPSRLDRITAIAAASLSAHQRFLAESPAVIEPIVDCLVDAIRAGNKLLLAGNGGSAADAQHVAGEFVGRFLVNSPPWPALALTTDSSILTCVGNDWDFDQVFARQVAAFAKPGDVFVGISTSGNSPNILHAVAAARLAGCVTIGFTGGSGGQLATVCERSFIAPAKATPRIQELHILAWHAICEIVEQDLLANP